METKSSLGLPGGSHFYKTGSSEDAYSGGRSGVTVRGATELYPEKWLRW